MGLQSGFIVLQGVTFAAILFGAVYYLVLAPDLPNNAIVPIFWMIALLFVGGKSFCRTVGTAEFDTELPAQGTGDYLRGWKFRDAVGSSAAKW